MTGTFLGPRPGEVSPSGDHLIVQGLRLCSRQDGFPQAASVNKCKPSCVAGNFKQYPVNLAVREVRLRKCSTKKRALLERAVEEADDLARAALGVVLVDEVPRALDEHEL